MEFSSYSVHAITRRKSLTPRPSFSEEHQQEEPKRLKRTLELHDLIFYGVGCSVGAGIYSLVGIGAGLAGPSIALSFMLCGVACCFTSLAYAEFGSRCPLAGSAYTFSYVAFGELIGWCVGWNLTLGYGVSSSAVARSWAEYLVAFTEGLVPTLDISWLTKLPIPLLGKDYTCCPLAMAIIGFCTIVLVTGAKESARFNTAMTVLNLGVLGFVLLSGVGSGTVHSDNLHPVFPHGVAGMARGAGLVFFAYLGFDMVACLSEEVKNPERNLPIGIIGSLVISMSIYVAVSLAVVGMAPVPLLGEDVPIINALLANACCSHADQLLPDAPDTCLDYSCLPVLHPLLYHGSRIISFGAIFGLTTATFACLMGQPRIFFSMALDGLIPKTFARINPKTGVPSVGTILTGVGTALAACLVDLESLANVISLGTLQVFTFVNAGVILLRMRPPITDDTVASSVTTNIVEPSPLVVQDERAAMVARSLGLVQQTSFQIRESIRSSLRTTSGSIDQVAPHVNDNGTKPIWLVLAFTVSAVLASVAISSDWPMSVLLMCVTVLAGSAIALFLLPKSPPPATFQCPFVPAVPLIGILCNSYMMGSMPASTWYAIMTWLLAGLLCYFGYGIHHSELKKIAARDKQVGVSPVLPTDASPLLPPSTLEGYHSTSQE